MSDGMPAILDDMVDALVEKGYTESQAFAIATKHLQKRGLIKKGTRQLTTKGKAYSKKKKR
jgi:hypothetical protein